MSAPGAKAQPEQLPFLSGCSNPTTARLEQPLCPAVNYESENGTHFGRKRSEANLECRLSARRDGALEAQALCL
jgi:hypothetical protein